ncbi:hypothetical protein KGQ19_48850, partial [Catenulispora sp. NL8]
RSPADATEGNEPKTSRKNGKTQWFGTGDPARSAASLGVGNAALACVPIPSWRVRTVPTTKTDTGGYRIDLATKADAADSKACRRDAVAVGCCGTAAPHPGMFSTN